ncbi:MAG TPA: hypothetical protein VK698_36060 [Kofleriaceae bacterium]|nr:hypothetical protein [Kofleriaceae bacterium]
MRDGDWMEALAASPEDDRLRRRFADALVAAGDPWAELVSLQIDRASRASERREREREAELIEELGPRWSAPLAAIPGVRDIGFERGAPGRLVVDAAALGVAGPVMAGFPIAHLDVIGLGGRVDRLAAYPRLGRLLSLGLADAGIDDDGAGALAALGWSRLAWLDLAGNPIGRAGVEQIAAAPALRELGFLGLERTRFDPRERPSSVDWDGTVLALELPAEGAELIAKHGERAWLRWRAGSYHQYPPPRR